MARFSLRSSLGCLTGWRIGRHEPDDPTYRVYTTRYDRQILAEQIDEVLGPASVSEDEIFESEEIFLNTLQAWRLRADIAAVETAARVRRRCNRAMLRNTVVSLLIDHSGSMRGQKILLAAAAAGIAVDFLHNLGTKVEVLGFTTSSWCGGESREQWIAHGRPPQPGRLCDLLHIVYQEAGSKIPGAPRSLAKMLRPDLLKENVDGEAVQWAAARLRLRGEARKILVVLSDGVPVDDSTLLENGLDYLSRHLASVLSAESAAGKVQIAGIGICYAPEALYATSINVETPDDLGHALLGLLETVLSRTESVSRAGEAVNSGEAPSDQSRSRPRSRS